MLQATGLIKFIRDLVKHARDDIGKHDCTHSQVVSCSFFPQCLSIPKGNLLTCSNILSTRKLKTLLCQSLDKQLGVSRCQEIPAHCCLIRKCFRVADIFTSRIKMPATYKCDERFLKLSSESIMRTTLFHNNPEPSCST